METSEAAGPSSAAEADKKFLTVRQAAFIGAGAMVGAGIFALPGAAGPVAGAAVRLSFLLAGVVALIHEPASIVTLAGILVLSAALDCGWKHFRHMREKDVQLAH